MLNKKEVERQRLAALPRENKKMPNEKLTEIAQQMFDIAERGLESHMYDMVERAKRLVDDLERDRKYFMEYKKGNKDNQLMTRGGQFESALRTVQNCFNNYDTSDAARRLAKFEKADALLKTFKGEKISLW